MIYLDYNATTPCDPKVVEAMLPYFNQKFGNAASKTHSMGWVADEAVTQSRGQVANLINASKEEIVFTSGSTEACNLAIKGVYELYKSKGNHIITCATEHKAVLDTCRHLALQGARITYLPVNENGLIDLQMLEAAIDAQTVLIAIMYANNETGALQPVAEIGEIAKRNNVLFFCDATQAIGKVSVNVLTDQIDLLCLSAHKFYGPKGVGALYLRRKSPRARVLAQIDGGGHERGFRSGTLNVPGIVGMGMAATLCNDLMGQNQQQAIWRNLIEVELSRVLPMAINAATAPRLPNVSNLSFLDFKAERLIAKLNTQLAFSVGSACTSASNEPSHVLNAMGLSPERIYGAIRLSLGRFTTVHDIEMTIALLIKTGQMLSAAS